MKGSLRRITQSIAFLLTLVFISAATVSVQPCMSASKAPIASNQSNSNIDEETPHHDADVLDQTHVEPFGYSVFVPQEPLPLIGLTIPPLHRPPLA